MQTAWMAPDSQSRNWNWTPPPPLEGLSREAGQGRGEEEESGSAPWATRTCRPLLAVLLVAISTVAGGVAAAQTPDTTKRIFVLPPVQWNDTGASGHYATQQSARDLARVMGGMTFGLTPEDVSQHLPKFGTDLHWNNLPAAREFSEEVRFVRIPMRVAVELRAPVTACFGDPSHVVLLFRRKALFRISWRFLPDQSCPGPYNAAAQLYASFVPIAATVAISVHYRTGSAEVVDVTDPGAGPLIAQRWQARGQ